MHPRECPILKSLTFIHILREVLLKILKYTILIKIIYLKIEDSMRLQFQLLFFLQSLLHFLLILFILGHCEQAQPPSCAIHSPG